MADWVTSVSAGTWDLCRSFGPTYARRVPDVDARIQRVEQGVVTIVLLAGFVFSIPWMYAVAAVLPLLDAALGVHGPTTVVWNGVFARRLGVPRSFERAAAARAQYLVVFAVLVIATLLLLADLGSLATILAVLTAAVSAAAATGLFSVGVELDRRNRPRRRGGGRAA
jgi:O-antigen/teichoic acid export membrane protein